MEMKQHMQEFWLSCLGTASSMVSFDEWMALGTTSIQFFESLICDACYYVDMFSPQ